MAADKARQLSVSSVHTSSWLLATPSPDLGLHLDPDEIQMAIKWWLDIFWLQMCNVYPDPIVIVCPLTPAEDSTCEASTTGRWSYWPHLSGTTQRNKVESFTFVGKRKTVQRARGPSGRGTNTKPPLRTYFIGQGMQMTYICGGKIVHIADNS